MGIKTIYACRGGFTGEFSLIARLGKRSVEWMAERDRAGHSPARSYECDSEDLLRSRDDFEEFDFEHQRGPRLDAGRCAFVAIGEIRWAD
jgi:hypothetical protein